MHIEEKWIVVYVNIMLDHRRILLYFRYRSLVLAPFLKNGKLGVHNWTKSLILKDQNLKEWERVTSNYINQTIFRLFIITGHLLVSHTNLWGKPSHVMTLWYVIIVITNSISKEKIKTMKYISNLKVRMLCLNVITHS